MLLLKHSFDSLLNLKPEMTFGNGAEHCREESRGLEGVSQVLFTGSNSHSSFFIQKLTSIKIQNDKMRTGNLPANMKKNRVLQIIPCKFSSPPPGSLLQPPVPAHSSSSGLAIGLKSRVTALPLILSVL